MMKPTSFIPFWAIVIALSSGCLGAPAPLQCELREPAGPAQINSDCIDLLYRYPVIDRETDSESPAPHHRIIGHFEGTSIRFSIYLPPLDDWQGRFFQHVYPTQNHSAIDLELGSALKAGAYFVQNTGTPGYRADAAAAKFSRHVARAHYNYTEHIFGYIYGGSGGSLQGVGAIENTLNIWDGACLTVLATPPSNPPNAAAKALAAFVLRDQAHHIADAVRPGGSGDPYATLNALQRDILLETSRMGVPLRAWEDFDSISDLSLLLSMRSFTEPLDPSYAYDHWNKPGYVGTEDSELGSMVRGARLVENATVAKVIRNVEGKPVELELDSKNSSRAFEGVELTVHDIADGSIEILQGTFTANGTIILSEAAIDQASDMQLEGASVGLDNFWYLSMLSYHRHQIPHGRSYPSLEQFLDDTGAPLFPQRSLDVARIFSESLSGGATHTGNITGKLILIDNLLDSIAFPWQADWYHSQINQALGSRSTESVRIWFHDHVGHNAGTITLDRKKKYLVQVDGMYHQALRDLSDWVETGKEPPNSTSYSIKDGQVLPTRQGQGLQPKVRLESDGLDRIEGCVGYPITLEAHIELSDASGELIMVEWDHLGTGEYSATELGSSPSPLVFFKEVTYGEPGTYFPNVRVTTHRDGDSQSPYHRIMTLGRARVIAE